MEFEVCIRNLSRTTTLKELYVLFAKAGDVMSVNIIQDRTSGQSKGFAFVAMSAQSEADRAVSMFNSYYLADHQLMVMLTRPREHRGFR